MVDQLTTLAIGSGRTQLDVLEFFAERAAIREYLGGQSRDEAERGALEDTKAWLARKGER